MKKKDLLQVKLNSLSRSKFRSSFYLSEKDLDYIDKIGMDEVKKHAYDFVVNRLNISSNMIDGKQTPMKGHPVFIAQHACGCCCRKCLFKWHNIPMNRNLTSNEVNYIVSLLMTWIMIKRKENGRI